MDNRRHYFLVLVVVVVAIIGFSIRADKIITEQARIWDRPKFISSSLGF